MKKFVIASPRQGGGGPIVLHLLCKLLCDKKYDAKIFYLEPVPEIEYNGKLIPCSLYNYSHKIKYIIDLYYITFKEFIKFILFKMSRGKISRPVDDKYEPIKGCKRKFLPFVGKNTIVIYPEICYGNILHSKKTVRWLLYHNMFENDEKAFGKNDLIVCYRKVFNDLNINPKERELYLSNFDRSMYKQTNFSERSGKCYIIRKGRGRSDLPEEFDGPILDDLPEEKIVEAFNAYKYCYFYDTQTFYSSIAAVCGCIPIVVCEPGKNKTDYRPNEDVYGVAYEDTDEEIQYALSTRQLLFEQIEKKEAENEKNICDFIKLCDKFFFESDTENE